jgi:D-cysteine desulfhydrase
MTTTDRGRRAAIAAAATLAGVGSGLAYLAGRVNRVGRFSGADLARLREGGSCPLFDAFPRLADRIPWRPLGRFPTPVEPVPTPGGAGSELLVKRDDLSSPLYGGNKVRKLEHFLAEAELAGCRTLITLGGTGSNHALATAFHGGSLGFEVDLVLYDQPVTPYVKRNFASYLHAGARLHHGRSIGGALLQVARLWAVRARQGGRPYFIMVGGSSRLGCLGYVSAGLELAAQVAEGVLPEPRRIFLPLGTCGTAAGLVVGLKLGGLRSRVTAVRVAEPFAANAAVLRFMAQDAADFLRSADPTVPRLRISGEDFDVLPGFLGTGYGHPTAAAERAVRLAAPGLALETTYSGKTFAACLEQASRSRGAGVDLFWNTYSSAGLPSGTVADESVPESLRWLTSDPPERS